MPDNGRKEFSEDGSEYDLLEGGKKLYCYLSNSRNVKFIKTRMNRRFRRRSERRLLKLRKVLTIKQIIGSKEY